MTMSTYNELTCRTTSTTGVLSVNYSGAKDLSQRITSHQPTISEEIISTSMNPPSLLEEPYDIPRPINNIPHSQNTTPNASISSLLSCDCSLTSSSNRSSLNNISDYDMPRKKPVPIRALHQSSECAVIAKQPFGTDQNSQHQVLTIYNTPLGLPLQSKQMISVEDSLQISLLNAGLFAKDVPFEVSFALNVLAKLQTEANLATARLLSFVVPKRNDQGKIEQVVIELRPIIRRLRVALHELLQFIEGVSANINTSDNPVLGQRLTALIKSLKDADKIIERSSNSSRSPGEIIKFSDNIEQLITCSQSIMGDIRETAVFIQDNAVQLFKPNHTSKEMLSACFDDNDTLLKAQGSESDIELENIIKGMQKNVSVSEASEISKLLSSIGHKSQLDELTNKEILFVKYSVMQIITQMGYLRQAVDAFLETVERNQPPKLFMAHGKFVVINAHNLLTISDIIHQKIFKSKIKHAISRYAELLAEGLKTCVLNSKKATIHFPSVSVVQDMVDSVIAISHLAFDLEATLLQVLQQI